MSESLLGNNLGGGGGYFLVIGEWGCATGWGRIFTTGLTIMGLHFQQSYDNGIVYFRDLGGENILASRDFGYFEI